MKKALLVAAAVAGTGYGAYQWQRNDAPPAPRQADVGVTDRIWIDHLPRTERELVHIFAALSEEGVGIFQATTRWKGEFELFIHEHHANELRIVYPQTDTREHVKAKATECKTNGMDYCLELEGSSHGVKRYYSREGWEIGSIRDLDTLKAKLAKPE